MDKWISELIAVAVATAASVLFWAVRTILTSARKVELLEKEIADRDRRRDEDRQAMQSLRTEFREEMRELRAELHKLMIK